LSGGTGSKSTFGSTTTTDGDLLPSMEGSLRRSGSSGAEGV
jgi:hypothetical protein